MNFQLNEQETNKWRKFDNKHRKKCCKNETGVGNMVKVRCSKCGIEKDITEYDRW